MTIPLFRINRRQMLAGTVGLAAGAAAGAPFAATPAYASTPKRGGQFRFAIVGASTADTLDPATFADIAPGMMSWNSRSNLVELGPDLKLKPELAESWEGTDGGRKWVFRLRQGVEFHNGKTLEAEDVLFSLNHHLKPDSKSAIKSMLADISEIKADGKFGLIITLKEPNADFPYVLADYHAQIVPHNTTDFGDGVGTGPYVMKSFEPGVRWTGSRNPNYFKEGHGNFDEVDCRAIADSTARMNALLAGELDAVMFVDLKTLSMIESNPSVRVLKVASGTHMTLPMNMGLQPFDNRDVRLALKYAIDREEIVEKVLNGNGEVANDHPISPLSPYFNSELPQKTFDPDKARFHLKQAGLSDMKVPLSASNIILEAGEAVADLYSASALKAGITIEVVREPADGYWSNVWQKKPWCQSYFGTRPTPDGIFSLAYASDAPWNESFIRNADFDSLLRQGRSELDEAKRKAIYGEMQRILSDDGGTVIPFFASSIDATSDKVATGEVSGNLNMDGGRAADRWWFT
ncbi:ABC transporter substrate-binding protein [Aestuariivirga sp.]|uniref:ABC transporter substrate-binding protein n=1 Tax=Aestuariivirga sp. TaxID=2650926 RepID=UPI00391C76EA